MSNYQFNDGGREAAGYKGFVGDCVTRAIAIATGLSYKEVYDALRAGNKEYSETSRSRVAKKIRSGSKGNSVTSGVHREVYEKYLTDLGWKFVPTMLIGQGCKVHLNADELPAGNLICRVSKHMCAMIDGVIHDTHDPSRGGNRCVYGYYIKEAN